MNIIKVEIADEPIIEGRSGISKNNKPYSIPSKHKAYLHGVGRYPLEFEAPIQQGQSPYKPGMYLLAGRCFEIGEYGLKFSDRDLHLIPVEEAVKALAEPKVKAA